SRTYKSKWRSSLSFVKWDGAEPSGKTGTTAADMDRPMGVFANASEIAPWQVAHALEPMYPLFPSRAASGPSTAHPGRDEPLASATPKTQSRTRAMPASNHAVLSVTELI